MHERLGPYRIERELGRGGMGVVYAARHADLGRPVAIKLLLGTEPQARARFAREATSLARLRHPNIVTVHELAEGPAGPYLVLDLIEGESLDERLRRDGPCDPSEAAEIAEGMCLALIAAHEQGILHRDLKPGNVLLRRGDGRPLLTDFGLALSVEQLDQDRLTATGELLGTPAFMAPEQANSGSTVDERTDVYGVGATLYIALTGRPPFAGPNLLNLINAVLVRAPEPPTSLRPEIPKDVEAVCLKCLEKDPANRYPSAEALLEDLRRFRQGEPVLARPALSAKLRRATRGPLALALPLLLAAVAVGVWAWATPPTPPPTPEVSPGRQLDRGRAQLSTSRDRAAKQEQARLLRADARIGEAKRYAGQPNKAAAILEEAWNTGFSSLPETSPARRRLARAYAQALFETTLAGDRREAHLAGLLRRVLAIDPDNLDALMRSARKPGFDPKGLEYALQCADRALVVGGPTPEALANKADVLLHMKKGLLAFTASSRAVEHSTAYRPWRVHGDVLGRLGEWELAREAYSKAIADRAHHDVLLRRGLCHQNLGNLEQARADMSRATTINPGFSAAHERLGLLEHTQGNSKLALEHLDSAVKARPKDPGVRYSRARVRYAVGDFKGALVDLTYPATLYPYQEFDQKAADRLLQQVRAKLPKRAGE